MLSAVYVVDRDVGDGGWPMEADPDLQGARQVVDFGPGRLFFYEVRRSARRSTRRSACRCHCAATRTRSPRRRCH